MTSVPTVPVGRPRASAAARSLPGGRAAAWGPKAWAWSVGLLGHRPAVLLVRAARPGVLVEPRVVVEGALGDLQHQHHLAGLVGRVRELQVLPVHREQLLADPRRPAVGD